jgi:hypothetical protein
MNEYQVNAVRPGFSVVVYRVSYDIRGNESLRFEDLAGWSPDRCDVERMADVLAYNMRDRPQVRIVIEARYRDGKRV